MLFSIINFVGMCKMFILVLCVWTSVLLSVTRSDDPGKTHPNEVEAAIGADFNITCYMNPKAFPMKTSSCLHFVIGRTNEELPRDNIVIANSTTIIYRVNNASEQQTDYRCKCGPYAITETKVSVGSRPRPVKDYSCRSYNFDYMICNFTKPINPILTTYNVSFYNDLPSYIYQPKCNYDHRNMVVCNTTLNVRYQEMYHFEIASTNALIDSEKPLMQRFDINNFEIMIPSMPGENLRIESLTVDSIKLSWQMANWEKYRLKGLQWEVLLKPQNFTVMKWDGPTREHNEMHLRLNNLPYAYWNYNLMIRVRVKNPTAIWSKQFEYSFRTAARRPQRAPRVEPGGFYIDASETRVTVYWEELLSHEYNGDNFTYVVRSIQTDGKYSDLMPYHQENNLAKFFWRKDLYYELEIRSRNHKGESAESSNLIIYPTNRRNPKDITPQSIHSVYHGNNRTYTLTWTNPKNLTDLLSFTVFWCYPKRALPNECKESMYFQQIPSDQMNFTTQAQNVSEERVINLAISANYYKLNTGLHWAECSMDIVNTDLVKMEPELMASANYIKVQWSVERVCPSILDGFNITYCEVANNIAIENASCLHNKSISKLARKYDKKYYIEKLKPYTPYKVSMLMFWRSKKGQQSEPQIIRTLEGAPSPPRQLRVEDVTNNSATIKWLEPTHPNGKIRKYIIMLNNDQIEVNAATLIYHLRNLESFTAYKVYVLAETVERSETSNDVHFTTAIGIPSPPGIGPNNNVANIIQWTKPTKPRGSIDFYEVLVTQLHYEDVLRRRISVITDATACTFNKFPTCMGAEYKTTVEVRAVNVVLLAGKTKLNLHPAPNTDIYNKNYDLECIASDSKSPELNETAQKYMNNSLYELYKSPWQTSSIFSCSASRMSRITKMALVVIAVSLGVMAVLYMARKKYNKMADINCTLPAGLETYFTKDSTTGFSGDFPNISNAIKETRAVEDQWINAARMHDINFRNEHHHLLASIGTDSGYLGVGADGVNVVDNTGSEIIFSSNVETSNINEKKTPQREVVTEDFEEESLKESLKSTTTSADALTESCERSDCNNFVEDESPLTIFPRNNGYIKQSMLQPWQVFKTQNGNNNAQATSAAVSKGYITVQNLSHALHKQTNQTNSNQNMGSGYVLQQDLQNFLNNKTVTNVLAPTNTIPIHVADENLQQFHNNEGYSTLEDLTKLNIKSNQEQEREGSNINLIEVSTADNGGDESFSKPVGISGYVTQQDLNMFAHHQHNF